MARDDGSPRERRDADKGKHRRKNDKEKDHRARERDSSKRIEERAKDSMELEKDRVSSRDRRKDEKSREKDRDRNRDKERDKDRGKEKNRDKEKPKENREEREKEDQRRVEEDNENAGTQPSASELQGRILKMKEERLKNNPEAASEVLGWVNRSRKLEEKTNSEKEKAMQLSKIFEEQDNIVQDGSEDEAGPHNLGGVKVLHGLEKVMEGGAIVLTLKDQSILANGDINEDVDMLENVEIGEQKRRSEAYEAAKKKTGIYDDKFNNELGSERKMLPQYDEPAEEEVVTLDEGGRFTSEAEKKLAELRKRIQGVTSNNLVESLNASAKTSSDYYTQEEMLQFKKPKKKKSLRKREKLDIDALEAEAISAGLGAGDLGSRMDGRRQALKEEQERAELEKRSSAYQTAYAKADEASKSLRLGQTQHLKVEEDVNQVFADDDEDLYKSLERARKFSLRRQDEPASGPQAVARLAASGTSSDIVGDQNNVTGDAQENKVVITEMNEFVWGLQLDEEAHKPNGEDVFMDEDEAAEALEVKIKNTDFEAPRQPKVNDAIADETSHTVQKDEVVADETIREVAVGKGLSGALKLLKDRGTLKETIEWGGRNMDKKKSKLVGIVGENKGSDKFKDIHLERTDEFGRILTPKEAFRLLSHKFHGKGPGKMKQEKRLKQYQEELKLKQMKSSDTPSLSVERMREAQEQLKTPYLVLSGHVKPGQTSDPRSGFATVEKDLPGGLTPMLGDAKVEHFLGIKRKAESGNTNSPKRAKS